MKKTKAAKNLLNQPGIIVAPGAYDALSAKLVELAGFPAVYATGAGVSAGLLGYPDVGLISFAEMLGQVRNIVNAVRIPVIADADTGYGNAINVIRTVHEFEQAGVAAIHLEDQDFPKKCGHLEGKTLISRQEMIKKIEAAVCARNDRDFIIIARSDARALLGLEEAIERGKAYHKAGADVIFVEAPEGEAEMKRIAESIEAPLLINLGGGGKTPMLPTSKLQEMGFKIAIYPGDLQKAAVKAMQEVLAELREKGATTGVAAKMVTFEERFEILGLKQIKEWEKKFVVE